MTLARYLTRLLATRAVLALLAITALLQIFDLFNNARSLLSRGGTPADLLTYAALRFPITLEQALPIAVLIGALATLLVLTRSNEMIALRSAGVTVYRVLRHCAPTAIVLAVAHFVLIDTLTPQAERRFLDWWRGFEERNPEPEDKQAIWLRSADAILRVRTIDDAGRRIDGVEIIQLAPGGAVTQWIDAGSAQRSADGWTLHDMRTVAIADGGVAITEAASAPWPSVLDPASIVDMVAPAENLSTARLRRILQGTSAGEHSPGYYATQLHRSYAFPLASPLMILLAAPAAYIIRRKGGATRGLGLGFALGMAYLIVEGLLAALGGAGALPPLLAAWAAPALFLLIGASVLLHHEE